jgi:hypothetical protein
VPCTSPPQRCSTPGHMPPQHLPRRSPASRWLLPILPCHQVVCPSRLSPLLAVAATPAPPSTACSSHVPLSGRPPPQLSPLSSSLRATLPPPLPELRRGRHARRRLPALAPARPHLSPDSEHYLELLACLLLHLHTLFALNFSCSDHHTSPDIVRGFGSPSAAPTTAPHPRSEAQTALP